MTRQISSDISYLCRGRALAPVMTEDTARKIVLIVLSVLIICSFYISKFLNKEKDLIANDKKVVMNEKLLALLSKPNLPLDLETKTKSMGCKNGILPDHHCTPGAVFQNVTVEEICTIGYSQSIRKVSNNLRKKIYAEYDLSYPQEKGTYEVDHLIPLELGGSNDIANLFPEAKLPSPGFPEKDLVENYLHQEVCAHRVVLSVAQKIISLDWTEIYNNLTSDQIEKLKSQYKNWSQNN